MNARGLREAVGSNEVGAPDILDSIWGHLPLELAINLTLAVAAVPTAVAARSAPLLAAPIAALCLAPLWLGALAVAGDVLDGCRGRPGCAVTYGDFLRAARDRARCGWALTAVPTFLLLAAAGTLTIMDSHPRAAWLAAPLLVDCALLALVALGCLYAFPLGATTALRGRKLWIAALACAGAAPSITASIVIVIAVLTTVTAVLGPGLIVAWPAPLAIYLAAMSRSAAGHLQRACAPHSP